MFETIFFGVLCLAILCGVCSAILQSPQTGVCEECAKKHNFTCSTYLSDTGRKVYLKCEYCGKTFCASNNDY